MSFVAATSWLFIIKRGAKLNMSPPRDGSRINMPATLNWLAPNSKESPKFTPNALAKRGSSQTSFGFGIDLTLIGNLLAANCTLKSPRNGKPAPSALTSAN